MSFHHTVAAKKMMVVVSYLVLSSFGVMVTTSFVLDAGGRPSASSLLQPLRSQVRDRFFEEENLNAEAIVLPPPDRGSKAPSRVFMLVGLDDVFPGKGLGEAFEDLGFREALREAATADLVKPPPDFAAELRRELESMAPVIRNSLKAEFAQGGGDLDKMLEEPVYLSEERDNVAPWASLATLAGWGLLPVSFENLDGLLEPFGVTGESFMKNICDLTFNDGALKEWQWSDIRREEAVETESTDGHIIRGWHQDLYYRLEETDVQRALLTKRPQAASPVCIMLGFPNADYDPVKGTPGVFPQLVKLSHADANYNRLEAMIGPLSQRQSLFENDPLFQNHDFPESAIIRPKIKRGAELLLYFDRYTYHNTPDTVNRLGSWRFL